MTRTAAAFATIVGILVMSMPGGMCFVLMGAGVDHHHHKAQEVVEETCFHEHDHGCAGHGHDHDEDTPKEPCDPEGEGSDYLVQATILKIDPAALPLVADFQPEWITAPERSYESGYGRAVASAPIDPPPPPVSVRLCRFLI